MLVSLAPVYVIDIFPSFSPSFVTIMSPAPWYSSLHFRVPTSSQVPSAPLFPCVIFRYHGTVFRSYDVYITVFSYYSIRQRRYWYARSRVRPSTVSGLTLCPWCTGTSTHSLFLQHMLEAFHQHYCMTWPATFFLDSVLPAPRFYGYLGIEFPVSASSLSFRYTVKFTRQFRSYQNDLDCQISPFSSIITEFHFSLFTGTVGSPEAKTPVTGEYE